MLENFWAKGMWLTNSPDFSPFENVWAILQEKADEADPPPSTLEAGQTILRDAWP